MQAEEFTAKLQKELNSAPQPYLVPFLKVSVIFLLFYYSVLLKNIKHLVFWFWVFIYYYIVKQFKDCSYFQIFTINIILIIIQKNLPYLRHSLITKELTIEGVRPPPAGAVILPHPQATTNLQQVQVCIFFHQNMYIFIFINFIKNLIYEVWLLNNWTDIITPITSETLSPSFNRLSLAILTPLHPIFPLCKVVLKVLFCQIVECWVSTAFALTDSMLSNLVLLQLGFDLLEINRSQRATSGEYGRWSNTAVFCQEHFHMYSRMG